MYLCILIGRLLRAHDRFSPFMRKNKKETYLENLFFLAVIKNEQKKLMQIIDTY